MSSASKRVRYPSEKPLYTASPVSMRKKGALPFAVAFFKKSSTWSESLRPAKSGIQPGSERSHPALTRDPFRASKC